MALPESDSKTLLAVTLLLLVWSSLFATVRVWAKLSQKKWAWIDYIFVGAFAVGIAQCVCVFVATTRYGFGDSSRSNETTATRTDLLKVWYASELLYVGCVGITRISSSLFLGGLSRARLQNVAGWTFAGLSITWTVAGTVAIAVRGDTSPPWETPEPLFTRWIAVEIPGLVLELALWIFAFTLIWSLNMPTMRRLKLILIFALRLVIIPLVVLRLLQLQPATYHGSTYDITVFNVYTEAVMHFALIAECLTCLKPFMQTFHEGFTAQNGPHYWGDLSASHPNSNNRSGGGTKTSKTGVVVVQKDAPMWNRYSRRGYGDDIELRTDVSGFSTRIEGRRADRVRADDDQELLPSSNIHVHKVTTMSVSEEYQ